MESATLRSHRRASPQSLSILTAMVSTFASAPAGSSHMRAPWQGCSPPRHTSSPPRKYAALRRSCKGIEVMVVWFASACRCNLKTDRWRLPARCLSSSASSVRISMAAADCPPVVEGLVGSEEGTMPRRHYIRRKVTTFGLGQYVMRNER